MTTSHSIVKHGSGNVFADLGHPEADARQLKVQLVSCVDAIVRHLRITQTEAGRLLSLYRPDMSWLLKGDFREYSLETPVPPAHRARPNVNTIFRQPRSPADGKLRIASAEPV